MCKNSLWDLINSNINKRDERDVQTGCTGYVHIAAIRMMRIWMVLFFFNFLIVREEGLWKMPSPWQTLQGLWLQWTVKPVVHTLFKMNVSKTLQVQIWFLIKGHTVCSNELISCLIHLLSVTEVGRSLSDFWRRGNDVKISKGLLQKYSRNENMSEYFLLMLLLHILPYAFLSTVEHQRRNLNTVLVLFYIGQL